MKITIALLFISFCVLSLSETLLSLDDLNNKFISKIKSNGDYQEFEKIKLNFGCQIAINSCLIKYPNEDCETAVLVYMGTIFSMTAEPFQDEIEIDKKMQKLTGLFS